MGKMSTPPKYLYLIPSGDILQYESYVCIDKHKGQYIHIYKVVIEKMFKQNTYVSLDDLLYGDLKFKVLPDNIDLNNTKALEVLYGI